MLQTSGTSWIARSKCHPGPIGSKSTGPPGEQGSPGDVGPQELSGSPGKRYNYTVYMSNAICSESLLN